MQYYALILDEAQNIKNPRTQSTQILHQVKASHRLCLTGTPMENDLRELWSLFHFLQPRLLSNAKDFNQFYRKAIEKNDNNARQESLMRRLKPFMLRRTKKSVATELPPKTEFIRKAELGKNKPACMKRCDYP
jgi:SNF2 family DNA or RNA helicase